MNLEPPLPPRGAQCPPPQLLEDHLVGVVTPPSVDEHLGTCRDCQGYVEALRTEQVAFLAARPEELLLRKLAARKRAETRRPAGSVLLALFGVALAALLLLRVATSSPPDIALKGSSALSVFARAPGEPVDAKVTAETVLRPGSAVHFGYQAPSDGQLLIFEVDGTGAATVFFPFGAQASAPVRVDGPSVLPGTVVLDAAPGPSQLTAVFRPGAEPIEAAPLIERLKKGERISCDRCVVELRTVLKLP